MMRDTLIKLLEDNKKKIDNLKSQTAKVIVFGAGNTTALYEKSFEAEGIPVDGVIDNDPSKINKFILGKRVAIAKDAMNSYEKNNLLLISTAVDKTYHELSSWATKHGLCSCSVDEYIFADRLDEIIECYDLFVDAESKRLYYQIIAWRLLHKKTDIPFPYGEQYFSYPEFCVLNPNEVFVDIGAYVGDSMERYLMTHEGIVGKIYAFEPDITNFKAMKYRVERLKKEWALSDEQIKLIPYGVGRENAELAIVQDVQGLGNKMVEGDCLAEEKVHVVFLDDFFKDEKVDFLKADIESFEYDMLCGAEKIIRRDRPKIAV